MAYPLPSNNLDGRFLRAPDRLSMLIAVLALAEQGSGMVWSVVEFGTESVSKKLTGLPISNALVKRAQSIVRFVFSERDRSSDYGYPHLLFIQENLAAYFTSSLINYGIQANALVNACPRQLRKGRRWEQGSLQRKAVQ